MKMCLAGARPVGRDTGLAEIQATAESLLAAWGSGGPPSSTRPGPLEERSLLDAYADHVRSFVDVSACVR